MMAMKAMGVKVADSGGDLLLGMVLTSERGRSHGNVGVVGIPTLRTDQSTFEPAVMVGMIGGGGNCSGSSMGYY